ncbi:UNVERIFIED_CONTAM: hypothetical protein Sradi_4409300 [Sesamum radiatum]|uniref:RNase H type-1 domain-containing protein n=1 Tax=Sesamum radiatum TaxID=300843 RepID=A0AAW2NPG9_SESRA
MVSTIKVNFDRATFPKSGSAGGGDVAHDAKGKCAGKRRMYFQFRAEPKHIELLAAATAVELCLDRGWLQVVIEGDCISIIDKLARKEEDGSVLGPLLQDVKDNARNIPSCVFSHVQRSANVEGLGILFSKMVLHLLLHH